MAAARDLFGRDRQLGTDRQVEHVGVAHEPALHHLELLRLVEEHHVQLGRHLHVADEPDRLELGLGQEADLLVQLLPLGAQLRHLLVHGADGRVRGGEAVEELLPLQLHLGEPLLHLDGAVERGLGGGREVHPHASRLGPVVLQRGLGLLQLVAERRDLRVEELERALGLVGTPLHVVAQVGLGQRVERRHERAGVGPGHGDLDHARPPPLLGELEGPAQASDGRRRGTPCAG